MTSTVVYFLLSIILSRGEKVTLKNNQILFSSEAADAEKKYFLNNGTRRKM